MSSPTETQADEITEWAEEMIEECEISLWKHAEFERLYPPPDEPAA